MIRNFFKRKKQVPATEEPDSTQQHPDDSAPGSEAGEFSPINPLPSAEKLCGIDPRKMSVEEIREKLKKLYKRHNEAAASLNRELREEAESMLDAIVECREKYVDH